MPLAPPRLSEQQRAEFIRTSLFASELVELADVRCRGLCRHASPEECQTENQLLFPYRGVFVRHHRGVDGVVDAHQVLFAAAGDVQRISHPIGGGDACLALTLSAAAMDALRRADGHPPPRRTVPLALQAERARLWRDVSSAAIDGLETESRALALALAAFDAPEAAGVRRHRPTLALVERTRLYLAQHRDRRVSLAEVGRAVGASPVYLTQVFTRIEGQPLYRYHQNLRLAEAAARLPDADDLAALAADLGFASQSQLTNLFRRAYGLPPRRFLAAADRAQLKNRQAGERRH